MAFFRRSVPFLIMLLLGAAAWRWHYFSRFLEYDEIWTLENFARLNPAGIFADLSTPNNHPVNSLLVKWLYHPQKPWCIRIGSWVFSCASILLGAGIARRIYGRFSAFYTFAALALLPPFVTAGATARGYAGQLFFLLLFAYSLLRCRKGDVRYTLLGGVSAVLAVAALPSSILYLVPMGGFFLWSMIRKKTLRQSHYLIFGAAVLFTVGWYFRYWYDFQETGKFAVKLGSAGAVWQYLKEVFHGNGIFIPAVAATFWLKRRSRMSWQLLLLIVFPMLAAFFTGAAPARVYLPGAAAGVMLMAPWGKRSGKIWFVLALALQFFISLASLPDRELEKSFAPDRRDKDADIMVYSATDGYTVRRNYPQSVEIFLKNLCRAAQKSLFSLRLVNSGREISGLDINNDSQEWQMPHSTAGNGRYYLYRDKRLPPGEIGFLLLPPLPQAAMGNLLASLRGIQMLKLNVWLTVPLHAGNGTSLYYMLLAVKAPGGREFPEIMPLYRIMN